MTFSLAFEARSDVGRVRKNNQDAGYASPNMLMVGDGMGGAAAGDLASAVAAIESRDADERLTGPELRPRLAGIIERTNQRLADLVQEDPTLDGMGTTFCAAMFSGEEMALAHIGDSRCYRLRGEEFTQLTHDHSWVQALIDEGRLTPEQAATHPHRSLILKVLNAQPAMTPDFDTLELEVGDRYLFCSDGLSGLVKDEGIRQLMGLPTLSEAAQELINAANQAGGHDNITVVISEVRPADDELDSAPAQLVGSATEREIPPPGTLAAGFERSANRDPALEDDDEHGPVERARYAPDPTPRGRRWPGVLASVLAILLVIAGATWGVVAYAQSRYFLAASDDDVGIYNGLPGAMLGRPLNTLVEYPGVKVSDLPKFHQRAVENTIGVSGFDEARATGERLRDLAEKCVQARQERLNKPASTLPPLPAPLPSGLSTTQPDYPTFLAPVTPTASTEADPEAC